MFVQNTVMLLQNTYTVHQATAEFSVSKNPVLYEGDFFKF